MHRFAFNKCNLLEDIGYLLFAWELLLALAIAVSFLAVFWILDLLYIVEFVQVQRLDALIDPNHRGHRTTGHEGIPRWSRRLLLLLKDDVLFYIIFARVLQLLWSGWCLVRGLCRGPERTLGSFWLWLTLFILFRFEFSGQIWFLILCLLFP